MDEEESLLNQAFDYDAGENIAVTDVVSFMQEIRAAPTERISELCNYFDDTDVMPFTSFIKLIQDFVEKKRNSFSEESGEDQENSEFQNTNNNLEGCGGDTSTVSVIEHDVGDLLLKNKSLSHLNARLRSETSELHRQIDIYEEEREAQREKTAELEKDIRQYQESKPTVQLILSEKDDLQNRLLKQQAEITTFLQREKNLKEESEDYRMRLSSLQDQHDSLSNVANRLRQENLVLEQENIAVKAVCETYQMTLDSKEEIIAVKTKECTELTERINEYESTIEDLREEKEALSVQVREVQFEYSICQKAVSGSGPGTPTRSNIQLELNIAEDDIENENYSSPICGTNYIKGNKKANSPLTESLRKGLLASFVQSPPSPRERTVILKQVWCEASIQTEGRITVEAEIQTIGNSVNEFGSQTEEKKANDSSTQTEDEQKDSAVTTKEDEGFDKRFSEIKECLKSSEDEIYELQLGNNKLLSTIDSEKSKSRCLTAQLGANRAKLENMKEMLAKEQDKVEEMTDVNVKLCSSKLDMWWENSVYDFQDAEYKNIEGHLMNLESPSRLVDALCLPDTPRRYAKSVPNVLYCRDGSQSACTVFEEECKEISLLCDTNRSTFAGRFSTLLACKKVIEEAITQRVEVVVEMMREILYSDDINCNVLKRVDVSFSRNMRAIQSLGSKLERVGYCIGARKEEKKMQSVLEVLSTGLLEEKRKYKEARVKLHQLSTISLDCQCLCANNMLSVLKNIERSQEIINGNATSHQERKTAVAELTGPFFRNRVWRTEKMQIFFEAMDKRGAAILRRLVPSKFWMMAFLLLVFGYLSFQWADYHVPQVI